MIRQSDRRRKSMVSSAFLGLICFLSTPVFSSTTPSAACGYLAGNKSTVLIEAVIDIENVKFDVPTVRLPPHLDYASKKVLVRLDLTPYLKQFSRDRLFDLSVIFPLAADFRGSKLTFEFFERNAEGHPQPVEFAELRLSSIPLALIIDEKTAFPKELRFNTRPLAFEGNRLQSPLDKHLLYIPSKQNSVVVYELWRELYRISPLISKASVVQLAEEAGVFLADLSLSFFQFGGDHFHKVASQLNIQSDVSNNRAPLILSEVFLKEGSSGWWSSKPSELHLSFFGDSTRWSHKLSFYSRPERQEEINEVTQALIDLILQADQLNRL